MSAAILKWVKHGVYVELEMWPRNPVMKVISKYVDYLEWLMMVSNSHLSFFFSLCTDYSNIVPSIPFYNYIKETRLLQITTVSFGYIKNNF